MVKKEESKFQSPLLIGCVVHLSAFDPKQPHKFGSTNIARGKFGSRDPY